MNINITTSKVKSKTRKLNAKWTPDFGDPVVWAQFNPEEFKPQDLIVLAASRSGRHRRTQGMIIDVSTTAESNGTCGTVLWADGSTTLIGVADDTRHVSIWTLREWEDGKFEELMLAEGQVWQDLPASSFTEDVKSSTL
jgi:hypothetical protein